MSKIKLLIVPATNNEIILTESEVIKVNDIDQLNSLEPLSSRGTDIFDEITLSNGVVNNFESLSGILYSFYISIHSIMFFMLIFEISNLIPPSPFLRFEKFRQITITSHTRQRNWTKNRFQS